MRVWHSAHVIPWQEYSNLFPVQMANINFDIQFYEFSEWK